MFSLKTWMVRVCTLPVDVRKKLEKVKIPYYVKVAIIDELTFVIDSSIDKHLSAQPVGVRDALKLEISNLLSSSSLIK